MPFALMWSVKRCGGFGGRHIEEFGALLGFQIGDFVFDVPFDVFGSGVHEQSAGPENGLVDEDSCALRNSTGCYEAAAFGRDIDDGLQCCHI
jgi:hypothetical protein